MAVIPDALRAVAARFPDRDALRVDRGETMTFGQWERRSNAVARGLAALGVGPGDRVAMLVDNDSAPIFSVAYFAAQKAGAATAPVNPRCARREIEHMLRLVDPTVVVASRAERARVHEALDGLDRRPIVVGPGEPDDRDWNALVGGHDDAEFQVAVRPDDLADILFTSGTTGLPKGVASTHENVLAPRATPSEQPDAQLHAVPLATGFGTYGALLGALRLGMTSVCLPRFEPMRFAALVAEQRPGWLLVVPAHVLLLRAADALRGVDTSSVWLTLFGTAPMPPEGVAWLGATFPNAMLVNGYGLTEAGGSACVMPAGEAARRPSSVGRPIDDTEIRIVDADGAVQPPGRIGEILIRIGTGRRFYYDDPDATARTWTDGWVHSGDLGYVDTDGYVYVVDRAKDMIIRGGYNVYSIEVEDPLYEHPAVVEAAVLGVPHDLLGQDVCAVVRLAPGAHLGLDELHAFLADRIADYKHPRRLVLVDEPLPRTALDKVDKKRLRTDLGLDADAAPGLSAAAGTAGA